MSDLIRLSATKENEGRERDLVADCIVLDPIIKALIRDNSLAVFLILTIDCGREKHILMFLLWLTGVLIELRISYRGNRGPLAQG